jgi:hypothetical protein
LQRFVRTPDPRARRAGTTDCLPTVAVDFKIAYLPDSRKRWPGHRRSTELRQADGERVWDTSRNRCQPSAQNHAQAVQTAIDTSV